MDSPSRGRSQEILERLKASAPADNAKLQNYLSALEAQLEQDAKSKEEAAEQLAAYQEAYEKLTAPANRLGAFVRSLEGGLALVVLGDTEYVAQVDPSVDETLLQAGARVRLNEGYAVVGVLEETGSGPLIKVSEALADGRLRVGGEGPGSQGRLVLRSEPLRGVEVRPGDEVRLDPTGRMATEHFAQKENQEYFVEEVPQTPWEAIGGQEEALNLIRESIEQPMLYPEIYRKFDKKPVKGILLYGPPGCGKTLIGKAIAYNLAKEYSEKVGHEVKECFLHISGPKILNMWLGETERMVRDIFSLAREKSREGRLVVIFIDEAESILRTRSGGRWLNISNTVVPQFNAEMDGLVSLENVVVVLTSNRPDYIDPAILRPERIDRKIKIRRPGRESSRDILSLYLTPETPFDPEDVAAHDGEPSCVRTSLVEGAIAHLWREGRETEFLKVAYKSGRSETLYWKDLVSGALLKSVVDRAKDSAIRRAIAQPSVEQGVRLADLTGAIEAEFKENEIFPKSDVLDDWLKLIDVEPEMVAAVKPIRPEKSGGFWEKSVV
jgi:proteasome-associated ATPase